MAEIKFCENNFVHGTEELKDKIENELNDVTVETEACLGYCGDCAVGPFSLVNGEFVDAENTEELYDKIKSQL